MSSSEGSTTGDTASDFVAYPPEEWEIFKKEDFDGFVIPDVADKLEGALLLYSDSHGYVRGQSRFVLDGRAVLDIELPASDLMLCGGSSGYKLAWQIWPRDIRIRGNTTTSAWIDIADRYVLVWQNKKPSEIKENFKKNHILI
jgi:hypothetical protein